MKKGIKEERGDVTRKEREEENEQKENRDNEKGEDEIWRLAKKKEESGKGGR